jgi:hypothetical protein
VRNTPFMREREPSSTVDRLQDAIDAVLVPHGFAAGQVGVADGYRQIIWCAAAVDFAVRFPHLAASQEPPGGRSTMCTDVVVDMATDDDGSWRVTGVSVEGDTLDQLLTGLGSVAAAERAAALPASPAVDCLEELASLLSELLDGPFRR